MKKYNTHYDIPDSMIPIESFDITTNGFIKKSDDKERYISFAVMFKPIKGKHDVFINVLKRMEENSKDRSFKPTLWAFPFAVDIEYDNVFNIISRFTEQLDKTRKELISALKYDLWKYEYNN